MKNRILQNPGFSAVFDLMSMPDNRFFAILTELSCSNVKLYGYKLAVICDFTSNRTKKNSI